MERDFKKTEKFVKKNVLSRHDSEQTDCWG